MVSSFICVSVLVQSMNLHLKLVSWPSLTHCVFYHIHDQSLSTWTGFLFELNVTERSDMTLHMATANEHLVYRVRLEAVWRRMHEHWDISTNSFSLQVSFCSVSLLIKMSVSGLTVWYTLLQFTEREEN